MSCECNGQAREGGLEPAFRRYSNRGKRDPGALGGKEPGDRRKLRAEYGVRGHIDAFDVDTRQQVWRR